MGKRSKERLQREIEHAREELDRSLETVKGFENSYLLSVRLDELIAEYVEICEAEMA